MNKKNILGICLLVFGLGSCMIFSKNKYDTDAWQLEYSEFKQPGQGQMWQPDFEYTFRTNLTRSRRFSRTLIYEEVQQPGLYILEVDADTNIGIVDLTLNVNGTEATFQMSSPNRILETFRQEIILEQQDTLRLAISAIWRLSPEGTIRIRPRLYSAEDFD
jgi:hypothetical protein